MVCPDCAAGLEHCHGTLVVHADSWYSCFVEGCSAEVLAHALRIHCDEPCCGEQAPPACMPLAS